MEPFDLRSHLEALRDGSQSVDGVLQILRDFPNYGLDNLRVDNPHNNGNWLPSLVRGKGKTPKQTSEIVAILTEQGRPVVVTKTCFEAYELVKEQFPRAHYNRMASAIIVPAQEAPKEALKEAPKEPTKEPPSLVDGVTVMTAGTSDLPVAEEVAVTAELMGSRVTQISDVGVAGLHRLLDAMPVVQEARVLVIVAGMDAALAAVTARLVSVPIVAVPTSQGYGASFDGVAALLSMLNSCASGVAVVGIDDGFGGGSMAARINQLDQYRDRERDNSLGD